MTVVVVSPSRRWEVWLEVPSIDPPATRRLLRDLGFKLKTTGGVTWINADAER